MSGQPHTRSPRVHALTGKTFGPRPGTMEGCASDGQLTISNAAPLIVSSVGIQARAPEKGKGKA
jgi:hypothetical protein